MTKRKNLLSRLRCKWHQLLRRTLVRLEHILNKDLGIKGFQDLFFYTAPSLAGDCADLRNSANELLHGFIINNNFDKVLIDNLKVYV